MGFGSVAQSPTVRPRAAIAFLVGIAGLAFSMTILWLSMRTVMGIGGACASGGPYVPAVQCPDVVVALTPLSIFGMFIFGGLALWGGAAIDARWAALLFLGWPALFLSLGWNFLEFGVRPPGGDAGDIEWSWIFCGVIFVIMGGGPLLGVFWGVRQASGARAYAGGRVVIHPRPPNTLTSWPPGRSEPSGLAPSGAEPDVAARLERLARLHRAGDLTDAEFEAAKRATLEEAG
jgi:hypothetical protein